MSTPDPQPSAADIEFAKQKAKRSLPVSLLVFLALIAMMALPLPKRFVAFLPLLVAVVLGVRLMQFLSPRPGREKVWPALTLGIIGMLLLSLAGQAMFFPALRDYEACIAGAQTQQATADCAPLKPGGMAGTSLLGG